MFDGVSPLAANSLGVSGERPVCPRISSSPDFVPGFPVPGFPRISPQSTGYLSAEKESDGSPQLVEIFRNISRTAKN